MGDPIGEWQDGDARSPLEARTPSMPRVGQQFAGYQLLGVIGRGGMGVVYQAEHQRMARIVALKLLPPELTDDDKFRERFVRESRLAASMEHPHVIPIWDAGESNGVLYIAMRYVKDNLKVTLQKIWRLRPERALSILTQVGGALDDAHALGLVHRDVKPANVLIDRRDNSYLCDFGLTKHMTSESGLTGSGKFVGTIDYMAPEQIQGKQVDGRADIYALGCLLYEMLVGETPYQRDNEAAVVFAHISEAPPRISAARHDLPLAVDTVVAKAMAKEADKRYGTCGEFISACRSVLDVNTSREDALSKEAANKPPGRVQLVPQDPQPVDSTIKQRETVDRLAPPIEAGRSEATRMVQEPDLGPPAELLTERHEEKKISRRPRGSSSRRGRTLFSLLGAFLVGSVVTLGASWAAGLLRQEMTVSQLLLAHIPPSIVDSCQSIASHDPHAFLATEQCSYGGATLTYSYAHSGSLMKEHFEKDREKAGLSETEGEGNCENTVSRWWRDQSTGHSLEPTGEIFAGRVFCFVDGGTSKVVWQDYPLKILASAEMPGQDLDLLIGNWRSQFGPNNPDVVGGHSGME
jgi:serine/threonine protein kinase